MTTPSPAATILRSTSRLLDRVPGMPTTYAQTSEDTGTPVTTVTLTEQTVADLGNPDQITVTIEPGDTLNPPATANQE